MSKLDTQEWLKEVVELSMLYDFYGELLTESAKRVFEGYVLDDMTLAEISEETGVSRQGIHDSIKKTEKKLYSFEEKLHLASKFEAMKEDVTRIREKAEQVKNGNMECLDDIISISCEMLDTY